MNADRESELHTVAPVRSTTVPFIRMLPATLRRHRATAILFDVSRPQHQSCPPVLSARNELSRTPSFLDVGMKAGALPHTESSALLSGAEGMASSCSPDCRRLPAAQRPAYVGAIGPQRQSNLRCSTGFVTHTSGKYCRQIVLA